jgi:Xaa-Pro aminopeptidase
MITTSASTRFADEELDSFRSLQQLAYECAEAVASTLVPGVTEIEAARAQREWMHDHGVEDFFHLPFAWFGDRTALRWRNPLRFFPSNRRLEEGMPFILDIAPIRDGFTADIGYASRLGDNEVHQQLLDDLEAHRELILEGVRSRATFRDIYRSVDRLAARQGYDVRHKAYPGAVIAHQVGKVSDSTPHFVLGFGLKGLGLLGRTVLEGVPAGWNPLWNGTKLSDHQPPPGLWAVEPHLAFKGVGAKFEEILVVTEDDAYWLDDDLPHVRRWKGESAKATA